MRIPFAVLIVLALAPDVAHAQHPTTPDERSDVHLRNDCRLAARILETGEPNPHYRWALDRIGSCSVTGGAALAEVWTTGSPGQEWTDLLYWRSARIRDARVLAAVSSVASDDARSEELRLNALKVLAAFVVPSIDPELDELRPPAPGEYGRSFSYVGHRVQIEGSQPLPSDYATNILALLQRLAASDSDAVIRHAAQVLYDRLTL